MGLPSRALFMIILGYSFNLGRMHAANEDRFIKAIGIGGASATACYAVVCIFGSRAVALNFTACFWTMLVVMQVLKQKGAEAVAASKPKRTRTNTFATNTVDAHGVRGLKGVVPETENTAGDSRQPRGKNRQGRTGLRGAAAYQAALAAESAASEGAQGELEQASRESAKPVDTAGISTSSSSCKPRRRPWKGAHR